MTTFVMPSELCPVAMRDRARDLGRRRQARRLHRSLLFPLLQTSLGLRGIFLLTAGVSVLGLALTRVLPEPAGRSPKDITVSRRDTGVPQLRAAGQASVH